MELLKQRIAQDGMVLDNQVLKVDGFLNHQIDIPLMDAIGAAFAAFAQNHNVTKIVTIESSGIAPAMATARLLQVPVVFARKQRSVLTKTDHYHANVFSFTKQQHTQITVSPQMLTAADRVLLIDDFLANGEAMNGLLHICELAGATVTGIGIVIEKSFQRGRERLTATHILIYSLARIASLAHNTITFVSEE